VRLAVEPLGLPFDRVPIRCRDGKKSTKPPPPSQDFVLIRITSQAGKYATRELKGRPVDRRTDSSNGLDALMDPVENLGKADIAIVFQFVSETLGTEEWAPFSVDTVAGPYMRSDVTIRSNGSGCHSNHSRTGQRKDEYSKYCMAMGTLAGRQNVHGVLK
jgi:hypothetical protein